MNIIPEQLRLKVTKTTSVGISLHMRLAFFLVLLVLTMSAGIIVILLVTGGFTAGISESRHIVKNELNYEYNDIFEQYGQLSVQSAKLSKELSRKIDINLQKQNISFHKLSENPDQIEALISDLYETLNYSLQENDSSGAFLILDTTVNPALQKSKYSKAGLYIKNMEPNVLSSSTPSFTLLRGFADIAREHSVNLHTQWCMEFDVKNADYFNVPIKAAQENQNLSQSKLYYWCLPVTIPNTSEEVMLCSVPLMDSNSNLYGVCGFEVSSMLFKLSYMPQNNTYTRMFGILSPYKNETVAFNHSMIAGSYPIKSVSEKCKSLKVKEYEKNFTTYTGNHSTYLGYQKITRLYPKDSPFYSDTWVTAILVPKEDIVSQITRLNIILICLLSILMTLGIIISCIFSKKFLNPISRGIEAIKSATAENVPKTNVPEIDDLISYLAEYKREVSLKAEQDKNKIALLEQFAEHCKLLSPAERSVFNLYATGKNAKEISDEMFLSINTIKTHTKHIFMKLEITSREELLLYINMLKEVGTDISKNMVV